MAIKTEFLYKNPIKQIALKIRNLIKISDSLKIISGFLTESGLNLVLNPIKLNPKKVDLILIGCANHNAFASIDNLIGAGVDKSKIMIDLGHTRLKSKGFVKYHPMMHSKIYYFDVDKKNAAAIVGSHNMTSFALGGLNSEAAIYVEGDKSDPVFQDIRDHIQICKNNAILYDPCFQDVYAKYFKEYMQRLATFIYYEANKANYRDKTFIIIAEFEKGINKLNSGDKLFFRAPDIIKILSKLGIDVHLYIFDKLPKNPLESLKNLNCAILKYRGSVSGTNKNDSVDTAKVNYIINDLKYPVIEKKNSGYDFSSSSKEFQIIVEIKSIMEDEFEYKFSAEIDEILPILNKNIEVDYNIDWIEKEDFIQQDREEIKQWIQNLPDWIKGPWYKVEGFNTVTKSKEKLQYIEFSPYGDNFVMYSFARNNIIPEHCRGYCIRCKTQIKLDPSKPLCISCYKKWARYHNKKYMETYCHKCGKSFGTTMNSPFCEDCNT